jgi:hypothetical protein
LNERDGALISDWSGFAQAGNYAKITRPRPTPVVKLSPIPKFTDNKTTSPDYKFAGEKVNGADPVCLAAKSELCNEESMS